MLHIPMLSTKDVLNGLHCSKLSSLALRPFNKEGGRGNCFVSPSNYYFWFTLSQNGKVHERGKSHLKVNATNRLSHLVVALKLHKQFSSQRMQRDGTPAGALHTAAFSTGLVGAARLSQSARSYANVISL